MNRKIKMKIYSIETGTTPNTKSLVTRFCMCDVMFSLQWFSSSLLNSRSPSSESDEWVRVALVGGQGWRMRVVDEEKKRHS
jgi:hypothetical protein